MDDIESYFCKVSVNMNCVSQCDFCYNNICDCCEASCLIYYPEGFDKCVECEKDK